MSEQIRVLVVVDDALVRAALTMLLAGADDIKAVGEAADGSEVEHAVAEHQPDVVLMDIRMPGMDGLAATITRRLIGHVTESDGGDRRRHAREQLDRLTEREREVAVAIGCGQSNAEISRELYMSIATVKAHVSRLLEKLGFNNCVQIALLADDAGEA
jgi:DNA-binding NarL/FixJ family response regulator